MSKHKESVFETEIVAHLTAHGWHEGHAAGYSRELALYLPDVEAWLRDTQPDEWAKIEKTQGANTLQVLAGRLAQSLDQEGSLHVFRRGFKYISARFEMCVFKPTQKLKPTTLERYSKVLCRVLRQVRYSKHKGDSIDLVFFVNGIPVATAELKTDFTQSVADAIKQYRHDRPPRDPNANADEPLLQWKKRALVHFAVSSDEVHMTTHLRGAKTHFLPFNRGHEGGKGNPPNPHGYRTAYLWEDVLQLDILGRFVHLEKTPAEDAKGRKISRESLIFPRFHQWQAVNTLLEAARAEGPGQNYLIQHSAGSGKSNSIAWVAHRLATLHDDHDARVFDSVIVVTDRNVLDSQLQETIYQFEHKDGVVLGIEDKSASNCTLSDNYGGIVNGVTFSDGINNSVGTLTATNCTLSGNGYGIYSYTDASGGTMTLNNTLVVGNTTNVREDSTYIGGSNNILTGTAAAAGLEVDGNGKVVLKNNGGPTFTIALVTSSGTAGNNTLIPAGITTDQRGSGYARIQGGTVDVGAFESGFLSQNQAPVNAIPGAQMVAEDTPLIFNGNLSVADPDAGASPLKVTLTTLNGNLTLSGVNGLSFTAGANGLSSMAFTGTLSAINAALNGLTFTPTSNSNGAASITLNTNDQGTSALSDEDTLSITVTPVNDAPVAVADSAATDEDTPLDISVLTNDSDFDGNALSVARVTVTADTHGVVTINANGTLHLAPEANFNGQSTVTYTLSDGALPKRAIDSQCRAATSAGGRLFARSGRSGAAGASRSRRRRARSGKRRASGARCSR